MKANIVGKDNSLNCSVHPQLGMQFFTNITTYMKVMKTTLRSLAVGMKDELAELDQSAFYELLLYSSVMVIVLLGCSLLGAWYAIKIQLILTRVHTFAAKMSKKTAELADEKKKTDR